MVEKSNVSVIEDQCEQQASLSCLITCTDCQFKAIICLMRPPDMTLRSGTIRGPDGRATLVKELLSDWCDWESNRPHAG